MEKKFIRRRYVERIADLLIEHQDESGESGDSPEACCYDAVDDVAGEMLKAMVSDLLYGFRAQLDKCKTKREFCDAMESFAKLCNVKL